MKRNKWKNQESNRNFRIRKLRLKKKNEEEIRSFGEKNETQIYQ